jgi:hypothetical protein
MRTHAFWLGQGPLGPITLPPPPIPVGGGSEAQIFSRTFDCPSIPSRIEGLQGQLPEAQNAVQQASDKLDTLEAQGADVETLREAGGELNVAINRVQSIQDEIARLEELYGLCWELTFEPLGPPYPANPWLVLPPPPPPPPPVPTPISTRPAIPTLPFGGLWTTPEPFALTGPRYPVANAGP